MVRINLGRLKVMWEEDMVVVVEVDIREGGLGTGEEVAVDTTAVEVATIEEATRIIITITGAPSLLFPKEDGFESRIFAY